MTGGLSIIHFLNEYHLLLTTYYYLNYIINIHNKQELKIKNRVCRLSVRRQELSLLSSFGSTTSLCRRTVGRQRFSRRTVRQVHSSRYSVGRLGPVAQPLGDWSIFLSKKNRKNKFVISNKK